MTSDFYTNGEYTADISNKMRVPDRIMAHSDAGDWNQTQTHDHRDVFNMQVPDRISGFNEIDVPEARKGSLFYEKEVFDMKVPDKWAEFYAYLCFAAIFKLLFFHHPELPHMRMAAIGMRR